MGRTFAMEKMPAATAAPAEWCGRAGGLGAPRPAACGPRRGGQGANLEEALHALLNKMGTPVAPLARGRTLAAVAPPPGLEMVEPPPRTPSPPAEEEALSPGQLSRQTTGLDGAAGGGGLGGLTTAMLRHVPLKLSQDRLAKLLRHYGFGGQFDFLYMPMDARRKTNRGVAFVNLISPEVADKFFHVFNGLELPVPGGCEKPLVIAAAEVQGFAENAAKHADGAADKRAAGSPLFLRPAPQRPPARAPPAPPALALPLAGAVAARPGEALQEPSRAAPQHAESRFCGYCGQGRRTMDHAFCPFCGGRFC